MEKLFYSSNSNIFHSNFDSCCMKAVLIAFLKIEKNFLSNRYSVEMSLELQKCAFDEHMSFGKSLLHKPYKIYFHICGK